MAPSLFAPVVHPVPVSFVPRGGKYARLGYLRRETFFEIPRAEPSEFTCLPYVSPGRPRNGVPAGQGREVFERGGRLWHPLLDMHVAGGAPRRLPLAYFLNALSRGLSDSWQRLPPDACRGWGRANDLVHHFVRTPLLASWRELDAGHGNRPGTTFVTGVREGEIGRVVTDFSATAEAGLREFFSREVALVGDGVFVRIPGPMAMMRLHERPHFRTTLFPRAEHVCGTLCRIDEVESFGELLARHPQFCARPGSQPGRLLDRTDGVPLELLEDDDMLLFACDVTRGLHAGLAWRGDRHPGGEEGARLARWLREASALAPLGILAAGTVEAQLRTCLHAIDFLEDGMGVAPSRFAFERDCVENYALPRLRRDAPVDEIDAEALAGFGPGF